MKKVLLSFIAIYIFSFSFAQTSMVSYHTNHFTSQYGTSGALPNNDFSKIVTRFTPAISYPCQLVKMKAWFRNCINPSQFNWVVYKDATGSATGPGNSAPVYLSTGNYTDPAQGGVQDSAYVDSIDLSSQNIIITAGDVYAGVTEHLQTNPFIGIAEDTANLSTTDRQWVFSGGWYKAVNWIFADIAWGITAYFVPAPSTAINENENAYFDVNVFPQPANEEAYIFYKLKTSSAVSVGLFDAEGKKLTTIINKEDQAAGQYSVSLPLNNLSNGIYFVRLESNDALITKKLAVIK